MESRDNLTLEWEPAEKDRNQKPFKSRIISFDGESQYIHLDYRLTEKIYSENKSDDVDEEKVNAEPKIEMFDISKITTNATIEAVRRFVHIELTRDWRYKKSIHQRDYERLQNNCTRWGDHHRLRYWKESIF